MAKYKNLGIDDVLSRACYAATAAYHGKRPDDSDTNPGQVLDEEQKTRMARCAHAWATIALAMQNERDYQERKIQEITTKATQEVTDATMRPDEQNGVRG